MSNICCPEKCVEGHIIDNKSEYDDIVEEFERKEIVPELDKEMKYTAYLLRKSSIGEHWSVAITHDSGKTVFTIELCKKKSKVGILSRNYNQRKQDGTMPKHIKNYTLIGSCETTARKLYDIAWEVLQKFKKYHAIFYNCQDFCNKFFKTVGFCSTGFMTAGDAIVYGASTAVTGTAAAVAGTAGAGSAAATGAVVAGAAVTGTGYRMYKNK